MKLPIFILYFTALMAVAAHAESSPFQEEVIGEVLRFERRTPLDLNWCRANLVSEGRGWKCEIGGYRDRKELLGGPIGRVDQQFLFLQTSEHCFAMLTAYPEGYKLQILDYAHGGGLSLEQATVCLAEAKNRLPSMAVTTIDRLWTQRPQPPFQEVEIGRVATAVKVTLKHNARWAEDHLQIRQGWLQHHMASRSASLSLLNFSRGTDVLNFADYQNDSSTVGPNQCQVYVHASILLADGKECNYPKSLSCHGVLNFSISADESSYWDGQQDPLIPTEEQMKACLKDRIPDGKKFRAVVLRY